MKKISCYCPFNNELFSGVLKRRKMGGGSPDSFPIQNIDKGKVNNIGNISRHERHNTKPRLAKVLQHKSRRTHTQGELQFWFTLHTR